MRALGCIKDKPDGRDLLLGSYLPSTKIFPGKIDYSPLLSPVRDQGDRGTCVAFASAVGVKEYQEKQERFKLVELSPEYLYAECKKMDGIPNEEGTFIRTAMGVLYENGVCKEKTWKYGKRKPRKNSDKEAKEFIIKNYARITNDTMSFIAALAWTGPFVGGLEVTQSWLAVRKGGVIIPMGRKIGGHAVCFVGYDRAKKMFKIKNSWGTKWGDKGYGYLSFKHTQKYILDAWACVDWIKKN